MLNIVSGNEKVMMECGITGDDLTGGYWESLKDVSIPNQNNFTLFSDDRTKLKLIITKARPEYSGKYRCVIYSQWGTDQSKNVKVTIKSKRRVTKWCNFIIEYAVAPPRITEHPNSITVGALQPATFTCEANGFEVTYQWKRLNSSMIIGIESTLIIPQADPSDEDQYYCVAMTKGGYAFSNNVTLTINGENDIALRNNMIL